MYEKDLVGAGVSGACSGAFARRLSTAGIAAFETGGPDAASAARQVIDEPKYRGLTILEGDGAGALRRKG